MAGKNEDVFGEFLPAMRVIFRGRVQGVGFRFTTSRIASRFPVTGFVKNLSDGAVELIAQGRTEAIAAFLEEIRTVMQENLSDFDCRPYTSNEEFADFSIRY